MTTSAARVWPPAGSWIMRALRGGGGSDPFWHVFTGDATWRVYWPGPALETTCGFVVGPLWAVDQLRIEDRAPEASCPRCLSSRTRARRPSDGWEDASLA